MANRDIDRLRQEANNRARAATRKIARLRNQGVVIAGSEFDPRRDPSKVAKYNTRQLNSYISELNEFTNRRNQFVGAAEGAPVPLLQWKQFLAVQDEYNKQVQSHRDSFRNVFVEQKGMTIEQFDRKMNPDSVFAKNRAAHRPLMPSDSEVENITGAQSVAELQKNLKKKMSPEYLEKKIKEGREQMEMMLDEIGAPELQRLANQLNDYQFNVLWSEIDLADTISGIYEVLKSQNTRYAAQVASDKIGDAKELMIWGMSLEPAK